MNPTTTTINSILQNWSLPLTSPTSMLPSHLIAGLPPTHLSRHLLAAIHSLSTLTIGQRERAHNLLSTYFQARIREGSYSGRHESIFAMLEVSDVEKACESARRMSVVSIASIASTASTAEPKKVAMCQEEEDSETNQHLQNFTEENYFPPIDMDTTQNDTSTSPTGLPSPLTPHTKKRRIHLLRIQTSPWTSPPLPPTATTPIVSLPEVQSSFTPLFKTLSRELSGIDETTNPLVLPLDQQSEFQPPQDYYQEHYYTDFLDTKQIGMTVDAAIPVVDRERRRKGSYFQAREKAMVVEEEKLEGVEGGEEEMIRAAQRATHEFNLRRIELRVKKREYASARWKCEDARRKMVSLRSRVDIA